MCNKRVTYRKKEYFICERQSLAATSVTIHVCRKEEIMLMSKVNTRLLFKVLEYLIMIGLSFISICLSLEAFTKYQSMDTNLAHTFQEVQEHPTITICFDPVHDEFVYGQDFNLSVPSDKYDLDSNKIQLGFNPALEIKLSSIISAYNGKCYKISPLEMITDPSSVRYIAVKFDENMQNVPIGQIYFTSEANSMGIARAYWYEGIFFTVNVKPNEGQEIRLVEYEFNYLSKKSGCNESQSWYDCYAEFAENLSFEECPAKCLSHSIRDGEQKLDYCKPNTTDWLCSNKLLRSLRKSLIKDKICPRSCQIREYEGTTKEFAALNRPKTILFSYYFSPPYVAFIHQEYVLFDFLGLISAVGGTLGIFIGLSILAVISNCFTHLVSWIEIHSEQLVNVWI